MFQRSASVLSQVVASISVGLTYERMHGGRLNRKVKRIAADR